MTSTMYLRERLLPILLAMIVMIMKIEAIDPSVNGYYIESPLFNFYIAPNRTILITNTTHITTRNVNLCTCRNACFAIGCKAFSIVRKDDVDIECRVSKDEPARGQLEENENAAYYFLAGGNCSLISLGMQNKTWTYPRELLEDVALKKTVHSSSKYHSIHVAQNINDGNDTTFFASYPGASSWITVDFGVKRTIFHVRFLPRQACCSDRFTDVRMYLGGTLQLNGDFSTHTFLTSYTGPYHHKEGHIFMTCQGVSGRYLSFQNSPTVAQYLEGASLEAYALIGH